MIGDYVQEFTPSISVAFALAFFGLLVVAFVSGVKSVRIRPYREGDDKSNGFDSQKVEALRRSLGKEWRCFKNSPADSVIVFCSVTSDIVWSSMAAIVIGYVFFKEHWDGLVQLIINFIDKSAGAAWADLIALFILSCLITGYGAVFFFIRDLAQRIKAEMFYREYLSFGVRPAVKEKPHLKYYCEEAIEITKIKLYQLFSSDVIPEYEEKIKARASKTRK